MNKFLRQALVARGYFAPENGGEGGSGGGGGAAGDENVQSGQSDDASTESEGGQVADDKEKPVDDKEKPGRKFSDEEAAKLLKENMRRKDELKKLAEEREQLKNALAQFDGLDPNDIKKLVTEKQTAEEERLKKAGEWDRLKTQMVEVHNREKQTLAEQLKAKDEELLNLRSTIGELTVGNAFGNSKFIQNDLTIPPNKARALYGSHFEFEEGRIVGYDKPAGAKDRTMLIDGTGDPLPFEEALQKIVQADPDYTSLAKSKIKVGANSGTKGSDKAPEIKADVRGVSRIAAGLAKQQK
jgi:hypothetical protein